MRDASCNDAFAMRDAMMPLGWLPGAEFRLANICGFVRRFYRELFDGNPHEPIPQADIWWDVTAVHRITGIFITEEWTTVQFCPQPTDYPNVKVWTNVRKQYLWWAELVGCNRQPM